MHIIVPVRKQYTVLQIAVYYHVYYNADQRLRVQIKGVHDMGHR
jgi:hypothetical protein